MLRTAPFVAALLLTAAAGIHGADTASAAVQADETPLAAIPDDVSVVIRWKTPQASFTRAQRLVQQIDNEIGGQMKGFGAFLGVLVSNPMLQGVDAKRDWWAAVFPAAQAEPGVVFIVPVTDAEAARQAVTGEFHFVTHGGWLLYTDKQPLAERMKARLAGEGKSVESLIGRESLKVFEGGDLSAFVNARRLLDIYRGDFDQMVEQVESQFRMLENLPLPPTPFDFRAVIGLYRDGFRAVIQGVRDSETLTVGIAADESGLGCEDLLTVEAGSPTAKLFEQHAPSELDLVGRLPADRLAYMGFHGDMQGFMRWGAEFEASLFPVGADVRKAIEELVEGYKQVKLEDYGIAFQLADLETGFLRTTIVTGVDKPETVRDVTRRTVVRMGTIDTADFKQQVELRTNAEDYGPYQADITTVRQEFAEDNPFGQGEEQFNQMMFGPEGLTTRTVYVKDAVIQTLGGGRPAMEAAVRALTGEENAAIGQVPAFDAVRERLTPEANLLLVVDVAGVMSNALRLMNASGIPVPFTEEDAQQLELKRSYAGVSISTGNTTAHGRLWISAEQAKGIANVARTIEKLANEPEF